MVSIHFKNNLSALIVMTQYYIRSSINTLQKPLETILGCIWQFLNKYT